MTIYVDEPRFYGYGPYRHRDKKWCHMMTDQTDLTELHDTAKKIGLKRQWFQDHPLHPHYDIVAKAKRAKAIRLGAVPVDTVEIIKRCSFVR